MTQPSMGPAGTAVCAACGAPVAGRFCSHCGAPTDPGLCPACRQPLSPGARFCHRCGAPVRDSARRSRERMAGIGAGIAVLLAVVLLLWKVGGFRPTPPPEMGNAGNAGSVPALRGQAPDISNLSPQERFAKLWDRVQRASESGDSVTVLQFVPMALGAYAQLDSVGTDERFHAALIHLAVREFGAAVALADTMLARTPGHLLAYVIRGEAAEQRNQTDALARSYRDFLSHYDEAMRAGRPEYAEHKPILDDFRVRALASGGKR